jgi:hypothetical protein
MLVGTLVGLNLQVVGRWGPDGTGMGTAGEGEARRVGLGLGGCQFWLEQPIGPAGRAAGKDLNEAGGKADQHADLPGAVIRTGDVEDHSTAPGAER